MTLAAGRLRLGVNAMDWPSQCAAVIPCLNEAASIESLVQQVRGQLPRVFVVDDGSTDSTGKLACRAGGDVLRHDITQGKGAALLAGWQMARERGFSWAMTLDGDGQHSPDDIPAFLRCADRTGAALIVGNRMGDAVQMPWLRRQVNRWMSRRLSRLAGRELPDSQCGLRLVDLRALSKLDLMTRHFEIESEVLLAFVGAGYPVAFVPIRAIYKSAHSKIHPWRDTVRWFRWLKTRRRA